MSAQNQPAVFVSHGAPTLMFELDSPSYNALTDWPAGGTTPRLRTNSLGCLCSAVASGLGWALLPCYAGDPCEPIARQGEAVVWRDLWMVMHEDVARVPRVRAAADWLAGHLVGQRQRLTGGFRPP